MEYIPCKVHYLFLLPNSFTIPFSIFSHFYAAYDFTRINIRLHVPTYICTCICTWVQRIASTRDNDNMFSFSSEKKATAMITTRIFFETILPLLAIFSLSNKNELQNMGVYSFGITNYPKTMNSNCFHFWWKIDIISSRAEEPIQFFNFSKYKFD